MPTVVDRSGNQPANLGGGTDPALASIDNTLHPKSQQNLSTGASAVQTSAFTKTCTVQLFVDSACYFKIGVDATATSSDQLLPANTYLYQDVRKGERISALQVSVGGTLRIVTMEE